MTRCYFRSSRRALTVCSTKLTAKPSLRRALSTTLSDTSTSSGPAKEVNRANCAGTRQEPLTLLHKTSKLVPHVLDYAPASIRRANAPKAESWEKILSTIYEDLSGATSRPIRLAVYGVDESCGSEDFVTALLSNPLASGESQAQAQVLTNRWAQTSSDCITISYGGGEALALDNKIELPTPYLQQFSIPLEILEFRVKPNSSPGGRHPISDSIISKLFEADVSIVLCNPLVTSVQSVLSAPLPSNTIVAIASTPSQSLDLSHLLSHIPEESPKPTLLIVDPKRASDAVSLLQSGSTSSSVVQRFQDAFNGSNVSSVTRTLESILATQPRTVSAPLRSQSHPLQVKFAVARLQDALAHCQASLSEIQSLLNAAFCDASRLNDRVEEVRAKVQLEFLGPVVVSTASTPASKTRRNEVAESVRSAEVQMKDMMSRFSWWKMVFRIDEITNLIASSLQQTWCPGLERKLLVHTGELHSMQTELTKSSFNLLLKHPVLPTNVLRNSLSQMEMSPQRQLTTNTLTDPIHSRKAQIVQYPTTRLHVIAQRAVMGMAGGVVGGAGVGWLGWMGWVVGGGNGLFSSLGMTMEPATAMGVGALTAAASIRWGVGRWEKGKRKWWEDWHRVGDGLDRDLRTTLDRCIEQQVGGVAKATSVGLTSLIKQREADVAKLREEVQRLQAEIKDATEGSTTVQ